MDWYGVYQIATSSLVAPILYLRLSEKGQLHIVPPDVRQALEEIFHLNVARNERQRRILEDTIRLLNADGIEPLLLKGSVCLLPGQTAHAAVRMLSDLDLVMVNASPERAEQVLLNAGYTHAPGQAPRDMARSHHLAPLFHPSREGYVELHRREFMSRVPASVLPFEELCAQAQLVEWKGLRCWAPSLTHRLLHNVIHQQIQDAGRFLPSPCSIRQMFDFAQIRDAAEAYGFDWNAMISRLDDFGLGDAMRSYLLLAELLFGQALPIGVEVRERNRDSNHLMWFFVRHHGIRKTLVFAERLTNLPSHLITPSWYPRKMRALFFKWQQSRRA